MAVTSGGYANILYGPQVLIDRWVLSPDERVAGWILRDMEDNLFMARDEVPQAVRTFYNTFAVSCYSDVNMFTRWVPSFGRSGGPFFKTSDEAVFLAWLRQMLDREQGHTLYLASGAPRNWLRAGRNIEVTGPPSYFGQVNLTIAAYPDSAFIDATVHVPPSFRGKHIDLSLHHLENRRIARVEIDGRPWAANFDAIREHISLPLTQGRRHIRAFF